MISGVLYMTEVSAVVCTVWTGCTGVYSCVYSRCLLKSCVSVLSVGAAAAAVMSSSKGATVLRPASGPNPAAGQPTVQHIIHQPIQVPPASLVSCSHTGSVTLLLF